MAVGGRPGSGSASTGDAERPAAGHRTDQHEEVSPLALWRSKKPAGADAPPEETVATEQESFVPQPDKAEKWFSHARTMADTFQYGNALVYYANGIKFDPEQIAPHQAMYEAAIQYANQNGKPSTSKDVKAIGDDGTAVAKLAIAEFQWMKDLRNAELALKALEAAIAAEQTEVGNWMARHMVGLARNFKKPRKSTLMRTVDLFSAVRAWDEAVTMVEVAKRHFPNDGEIEQRLKDISAERTMDKGGYSKAGGREGGFTDMVKDMDRQRALEESESVASSDDVKTRNLDRAREAYEADPQNASVIAKYAQLLRQTEDPELVEEAHGVLTKGYEDLREYRFRMAAGDIRIDQARRRERAAQEKVKSLPDDEAAKAELAEARKARLELQATEYGERIEQYPTNRPLRFDAGMVNYELGHFEDAIAGFQASKDEPKYKVRASHYLGRCFAAEGWHMEAVAEYNDALASIDGSQKAMELEIRYDLMVSLIERAREEKSSDLAREALEICSFIARRDITYRDIRNHRKAIDALIKELA